MGPLALMAKRAGMNVYGSDKSEGAITPELKKAGIEFELGAQDGRYLAEKTENEGIDWFVYTSALPHDHPELVMAKEKGLKVSKRDELIAKLVKDLGLKMVAVAGTHGKTTTTAMLVWAIGKLRDEEDKPLLPSSYLVGTVLNFAPSGSYKEGDEFFVYEADEYDRNFLHFHPWLSLITYVSYDHPDIYKTKEDYEKAFLQFEEQSRQVIFAKDHTVDPRLNLSGAVRREDATTAFHALKKMLAQKQVEMADERLLQILSEFPGARRRFERIADGIYTDYAHHPEEVKATVEIAREEAKRTGKKGVAVVYQPHQNTRQHEVRSLYVNAFDGVDKIFWLPTFLTREDESLAVITPEEFIAGLNEKEKAVPSEVGEDLAKHLKDLQKEGYLIILMTAGPADPWLRREFVKHV